MTSIFQLLAQAEERGEAVALCTVIASAGSTPRRAGSKMLVYANGDIAGTVGGGLLEERVRLAALEALKDGKPVRENYSMTDPSRGDPGVCGGQVDVYIEPILPPPTLVVIGLGHVGKAVAHLAKWTGFRVAVSDDRTEFCNPQALPDADAYYPLEMSQLPQSLTITPRTYLVLTTRGSNVDVAGLPALLTTPAAYIGVIGSRRRWAETCKQLKQAGVSEESLLRVRSPLGLEIQAETPEEIAISILAEILMLRDGGTGKAMSENKKS
jgi:xanthine dehydrogenase accessory factor